MSRSGMTAVSDSTARSRRAREALRADGGRLLQVRLDAVTDAALAALRARDGHPSDAAAVTAAIHAAAPPMPEPPAAPPGEVWEGLRPQVRARLRAAVDYLHATGELCRANIMRIGEISANQATHDLATIAGRMPGLMQYDRVRKRYVLARP